MLVQSMLTLTITLYLSKAIIVIVQMEPHPKRDPNIPYNSHMKGPGNNNEKSLTKYKANIVQHSHS